MPGDIDRYIRIENPVSGRAEGQARLWHTVPHCERLSVLEYANLVMPNEETGQDEKRIVFHVRFVEGVRKGSRVTFLGNHFSVLSVSDSKRLTGIELNCSIAAP